MAEGDDPGVADENRQADDDDHIDQSLGQRGFHPRACHQMDCDAREPDRSDEEQRGAHQAKHASQGARAWVMYLFHTRSAFRDETKRPCGRSKSTRITAA